MLVLGVELKGRELLYAVLDTTSGSIPSANKLALGDPCDPASLSAFQTAVRTLLGSAKLDLVGIKANMKKGLRRAGEAAVKMEALLLANVETPHRFLTGDSIKKCDAKAKNLAAYLQTAYKAAFLAAQ